MKVKLLPLFSTFFILIGLTYAKDPQKDFDQAWEKFSNGDFSEAEAILDAHLLGGRSFLSNYQVANFLYLKGHILSKRDYSEEAIENLSQARDLYLSMSMVQGGFQADLSIAKNLLDLRRLAEAETLLEVSEAVGLENGFSLGYCHFLQAKLHFVEGDYEKALLYSQKSLAVYKREGDDRGTADGLIEVGFYEMLTGNFDKGLKDTLAGQLSTVKVGDTNKYFYSMTNLILFQRCELNKNPKELITLVEIRAKKDNDEDLREMLNFVREYQCQPQNGGEGNPPPPPPPPN